MHAELCPVCKGSGTVTKEPTAEVIKKIQDAGIAQEFINKQFPCNGCSGKGWVEVHDEPTIYPPPLPFTGTIASGIFTSP